MQLSLTPDELPEATSESESAEESATGLCFVQYARASLSLSDLVASLE